MVGIRRDRVPKVVTGHIAQTHAPVRIATGADRLSAPENVSSPRPGSRMHSGDRSMATRVQRNREALYRPEFEEPLEVRRSQRLLARLTRLRMLRPPAKVD